MCSGLAEVAEAVLLPKVLQNGTAFVHTGTGMAAATAAMDVPSANAMLGAVRPDGTS